MIPGSAEAVVDCRILPGHAAEFEAAVDELRPQQSAQLAERISAATAEQVRGVEQVGQSVGEIAQIAERSSDSVQRGRQAAEDIQTLAGQLGGSLGRFRLPG